MKPIFCAFLAIILFAGQGCVATSKYNELKDKNTALTSQAAALQDQNNKLSEEVSELKKGRDSLQAELENLRKLPDYYYQRGLEHFTKRNYWSAAEFFELVVKQFPLDPAATGSKQKLKEIDSISAENYRRALRNSEALKDPKAKLESVDKDAAERYLNSEDLEKLLARREIYANELSLIEEMNKHILVEDDPTHAMRYYRTTRPTVQEAALEKAFYIELYIAQHHSGKKRYRIKARYVGDSWISYDSIQLRGENGAHIDIICKYPEKLSKMSEDKIFEWSDNEIDESRVNSLLKSGFITVRFGGGYRFSFNLNDQQLTAFREIAKKFSTLK